MVRGGLRTPKLQEVATFGDGAVLDVPGSPRVILTPGHTPGSAALHVPSLGALFVGDAFATYAVTTGARGPQVAPFTVDATQAVASLSRLEELSADLVAPGARRSLDRGDRRRGAAGTQGCRDPRLVDQMTSTSAVGVRTRKRSRVTVGRGG
jgi:glyoxylase-like metal-dependent hydrolase (beta-lactamase superfamily II)